MELCMELEEWLQSGGGIQSWPSNLWMKDNGINQPCFLQDPTPLPTPETPPVISAVVHATDEEKLAVTSQKWTCMTVDLSTDKQDYPQPSDLSTFVNETKFSSPTEGMLYTGLSASSWCCFGESWEWCSSDQVEEPGSYGGLNKWPQ